MEGETFQEKIMFMMGSIESRLTSIDKCLSAQTEHNDKSLENHALRIRGLEDDSLKVKVSSGVIATVVSLIGGGITLWLSVFRAGGK